MWFDEGFAEFYAYTRLERDKVYIGAPSSRAAYTKNDIEKQLSVYLLRLAFSAFVLDARPEIEAGFSVRQLKPSEATSSSEVFKFG